MRNLIAGINGFAGSHLADLLLEENEEVFGLARDPKNNRNIRHIKDRIEVFPCDIHSFRQVEKVVRDVHPQRIYHLAAVSFVPDAESERRRCLGTNFLGTLNVLEAVRNLGSKVWVLWVGSGEEYGPALADTSAVEETHPLEPVSLYGVSKAAADLLVRSYFEREGMEVLRVRPFNHIGPRQDSRFVCSSFARQIALIEKGGGPVLRTGNLKARRDFTDVRDTVRAYHAVMEHGDPGDVYNVCSGTARSIRSVLDGLLALTKVPIRVETEPARLRVEKPIRLGDPSLLQRKTGWHPKIPLSQTLEDLLNFWREHP